MRLTAGYQIDAGETSPDRQFQAGDVDLSEVYVDRMRPRASTDRFLIDYRQPQGGRHSRIDEGLRRSRIDESGHICYCGDRYGIITRLKRGVETDIYEDGWSMQTQQIGTVRLSMKAAFSVHDATKNKVPRPGEPSASAQPV